MQARSIEDCLKAEGGLARLTGHAARLLRLQHLFELAVPRQLAQNARVANLKLGRLVIHADNGAVAAKLRQITPTLLGVLSNEGAQVTGIQVAVQPRPPGWTDTPEPGHGPLGDHAKRGLTSLAQSLPEDSPLSQALRRLVKRA
jgi:hypothetical protein